MKCGLPSPIALLFAHSERSHEAGDNRFRSIVLHPKLTLGLAKVDFELCLERLQTFPVPATDQSQ